MTDLHWSDYAVFVVLSLILLGAAVYALYRVRGQIVGRVHARRQGEEIVPGNVRAVVKRRLKGQSDVDSVLIQFRSAGGIRSMELTPPQARSMATALEAAVEQGRAA